MHWFNVAECKACDCTDKILLSFASGSAIAMFAAFLVHMKLSTKRKNRKIVYKSASKIMELSEKYSEGHHIQICNLLQKIYEETF